jgi:hypothetical protein
MEYSVVVNNKFALFDDEDEDPLEVLQRSQDQAVKKPTTGKTAKDAKENNNAKVSAKNAKNTAVKDTKPATKPAAQPAKVLTPAQEQKPKPSAQSQPPRRENNTGKPFGFEVTCFLENHMSALVGRGLVQNSMVISGYGNRKTRVRIVCNV